MKNEIIHIVVHDNDDGFQPQLHVFMNIHFAIWGLFDDDIDLSVK
jgi:hypothetical protein